MQIREGTEKDIPEILKVLKASLGETSSKKTEEVWRFKHINNPFGRSLVLVAIEENKIIGVRAFMRWQWQKGDKIHITFRAVDTATHPEHQGKGVFKKLTLQAIELAKQEGGHFIFNTPNQLSLPGYLKMGWEKVDKLKVQIQPTFPLNWLSQKTTNYDTEININFQDIKNLCHSINTNKSKIDKYFTPKSAEYLRWRYEDNPLQKYEVIADSSFYMAGYVKEHKYFKELRIVEVMVGDDRTYSTIKKIISKWAKKFGATFISMANEDGFGTFFIKGNFGPVMTVRKLSLPDEEFNNLLELNHFNYNLGDLELF
ncbi:GNAT family N-acetyltransferase [Salegentibacter sp. F188]|uniref:GNAT family N-acetyltransferase n=1 Tax=Autumnicola patrickiae TaxID=3075591 RepID=A0ABU3E1H5_9FLAO|nr:GNAT family N-acetyltransferase [Salegentibacter sp. F188]MDT0689826.1 GNAT family N-acetyltransferase [Salegentibacter sp. F188]